MAQKKHLFLTTSIHKGAVGGARDGVSRFSLYSSHVWNRDES